MTLANCKTVCREIDELNVDQNLSGFAKEHVQGCESCQSFYDSRRSLRTLLAGLDPLEAPADFDFRVRARLASGEGERHVGFFGSRSFGVPAAALATLVFLLAAGFALRTLMSQKTGSNPEQVASRPVNQPTSSSDKQGTIAQGTETTPNRRDETVDKPVLASKSNRNGQGNVFQSIRHGFGTPRTGNNRVATRDMGTTPAQVVKQNDALASLETFPVFAVEAPSEPLKVSLDYETGVSRTISLPTLSFGSERAVAPSGAVIKTTSKGVW